MLAAPSANFTLPSLFDNLELDCRLYFPHFRDNDGSSQIRGCAIFAHPYAPLGGSSDDPVVHVIGSLLTRSGFILTTFNFRGADKSPGKTSWSGKAELADYVSIYTFMLSFLDVPDVKQQLQPELSSMREIQPLLLLGGYSYGSMITAHLPESEAVFSILDHASQGTAEYEIQDRSHELGHAFLSWCETRQQRGRNGCKNSDALPPAATTFGGYDTAHNITRDGPRSFDRERVRRSVEHMRRKVSMRSRQHITGNSTTDEEVDLNRSHVFPRLAVLLISPLLGTVSNFATMFSTLHFERRLNISARTTVYPASPDDLLSRHPSLVIFGTADHFTSAHKVRAWCESLKRKPGSMSNFEEVPGAGHFWHDEALSSKLQVSVLTWLKSLDT